MLGVGVGGPVGGESEAVARDDAAEPWNQPGLLVTSTSVAEPGRADGGPARDASAGLTERETWAVITSVGGLGPVGFGALLRHFGSGRAILDAAGRPGAAALFVRVAAEGPRRIFGEAVANLIVEVAGQPETVLEEIEAAGVAVVTLDDPDYPARLRAIEMPPHVLFVEGDPAVLAADRAVAVVGTRRATEAGRRTAARIGAAIATTGATVVSGLAVGIDGAAQAAVTAVGGRTVAVLGSGHARLYPRAHAHLARSIIATGGAIVSEMPPSTRPTSGTFPRRNRLISGLADATIVVEAAEKSGALITAGWALEQGRECFMVPGPLDAPRSKGCLRWLREYPTQVRIVAGIPELIEDLALLGRSDRSGLPPRPSLEAELIELGAGARAVATALVAGCGTLDELVAATGFQPATALGALTLLELRGLAASAYGRYRPAGRLMAEDLATPGPRRAVTRPKAVPEATSGS
jgi:DNA processing protein